MKSLLKFHVIVLLILGLSILAIAATDTDTQTVTITFQEIAVIGASGDPGTLTITAPAIAGDLPADQTDSTTTMAWTCNCAVATTRKITGQIDALFSGINLYGTVAATSSGGTSTGETQFAAATTDYDFVTDIPSENVSGETITFKASVSSMVAPYTDQSQIVTWTLTEDA
jgi:Tfp pilus assembly protein PilW